jgi:c-di-AMP phosphodiesterase-like protein
VNVWERMRADQRADAIGMLAFIAFLVVPIAAGVIFGWVVAALLYLLVIGFAVGVWFTAR